MVAGRRAGAVGGRQRLSILLGYSGLVHPRSAAIPGSVTDPLRSGGGSLPSFVHGAKLLAADPQLTGRCRHDDAFLCGTGCPVCLCPGAARIPWQVAAAGRHPGGGHVPPDFSGLSAISDAARATSDQHVSWFGAPVPDLRDAADGVAAGGILPPATGRIGGGRDGRWGGKT